MSSNYEKSTLSYDSNPFYKNQIYYSCPDDLSLSVSNRKDRKSIGNRNVVATKLLFDTIHSRVYNNIPYATGQVILNRDVRNTLTDGQHFAWRCAEWDKIEARLPPSKYKDRTFLESFMDLDPISYMEQNNQRIRKYLYDQKQFALGNERVIAIDSSFLVKHYTTQFMCMVMKNNRESDGDILMEMATNIFVEPYIPIIESLFKVNNSTRDDYHNIEFSKVNDYIHYSKLRSQGEVGLKIRCSRYEVHKELKKREDEFFDQKGEYSGYGGKWEYGIRNMINDHVIIDTLLNTSKKIPTSTPIIATNDRGMLRYAHKKNVRFITSLDDNILSSNFPLNGFRQCSVRDYINL